MFSLGQQFVNGRVTTELRKRKPIKPVSLSERGPVWTEHGVLRSMSGDGDYDEDQTNGD